MFRNVRKRVTYTNIVMTVALVFAMSGGAYAAGKYMITSTKQISPKVLASLKGVKGKNGAPGATGSTGPAGTAGPAGANGKEGPIGKEGAAGKEGASGQSVTSKEVTTKEAACGGVGGSEFTSASGKTVVCNGSPWTGGGTLPSGSTETGVVATATMPVGSVGIARTSISFTVPLRGTVEAHVVGVEEGQGEADANVPSGCKGNAAEPQAERGNLCVFMSSELNVSVAGATAPETGEPEKAGKTGAVMFFAASEPSKGISAIGTWAVTAK